MRRSKILLLFLILTIVSCKKDADKANIDFVGDWSSFYAGGLKVKTLHIDDRDGSHFSDCETICAGGVCDCESVTNNTSAKVKGNHLYVGGMKFEIEKEPEYSGNNVWTMKLDNDTYTRSGGPKDFCNNGIQDNGEKGIDCGGSCSKFCYKTSSFNFNDVSTYQSNKVSALTDPNGGFIIDTEYNTFESMDPVPRVELKFKSLNTGTYALDNASFFAIDINGGSAVYYNCTSGTVNIYQIDTASGTISLTYEFLAANSSNGKTVNIKDGVISGLIYKK